MLKNIPKNKIFFDYVMNRQVLFKECIYYAGEKRYKVILSHGFGASELNEILYVRDGDQDIFLKRFKKSEIKQIKQILIGSIVEKENDFTEMRASLFDSMRKLAAGDMKTETARVIGANAQVIVNSVKVEIDYKKLIKDNGEIKIFK